MDDSRQYFPATQRNRDPILAVLQQILPDTGSILEIASGSGEHAIYFAPQLPKHQWIPSDLNPDYRDSITAWQTHHPTSNLLPAIALDVHDPVWAVEQVQPVQQDDQSEVLRSLELNPINAIIAINMIHIAPWSACLGLMAGAQRILPKHGILYLYGPFLQQDIATAASNIAFDQSLRERDPDWGIRNLADVVAIANQHHLRLVQTVEMPANNLSVIFQRL